MDQLKRQYVFNAYIYICVYTHFYTYVCTYLTDCWNLPSTFFDRDTGFQYLSSTFFYRNALALLEIFFCISVICIPGKICCMTALSVLFVVPPVVFKCKIYVYLH